MRLLKRLVKMYSENKMNITMEQPGSYMSLYDYLGHAAGIKLGEQVYKEAIRKKVEMATREVSNKSYTGKVMLYPETFLKEYFSK
jgi:hypothetical protein